MNLTIGEVKAIIWATGYRPDYSWLEVPVLDRKGRLRHDGGVVSSPGMYLMGILVHAPSKSALSTVLATTPATSAPDLTSYLDSRLAGIRAGCKRLPPSKL